MSWMLEDHEKQIAEENRHARIGGCVALLLLLVGGPLVCWAIGTYTTGGQIVQAHALSYYALNGLPLGTLTPGLTGIARQSCDLDRAQPQPANLQDEQEQLAARYEAQFATYRQNYNRLERLGQDTSFYEALDQIPGNLFSAKLIYCVN
jgi:hypothetical protein